MLTGDVGQSRAEWRLSNACRHAARREGGGGWQAEHTGNMSQGSPHRPIGTGDAGVTTNCKPGLSHITFAEMWGVERWGWGPNPMDA